MPNNPNASDNLKPFEKGQSGNPGGRPKSPISQCLKELGSASEIKFTIEKTDKDGTKTKTSSALSTGAEMTLNQAVAARLFQMALNGDMKAIRELLNRTEGRVPQPINLGGQKDNPFLSANSGKTWVIEDNTGGTNIPDPDDD